MQDANLVVLCTQLLKPGQAAKANTEARQHTSSGTVRDRWFPAGIACWALATTLRHSVGGQFTRQSSRAPGYQGCKHGAFAPPISLLTSAECLHLQGFSSVVSGVWGNRKGNRRRIASQADDRPILESQSTMGRASRFTQVKASAFTQVQCPLPELAHRPVVAGGTLYPRDRSPPVPTREAGQTGRSKLAHLGR